MKLLNISQDLLNNMSPSPCSLMEISDSEAVLDFCMSTLDLVKICVLKEPSRTCVQICYFFF